MKASNAVNESHITRLGVKTKRWSAVRACVALAIAASTAFLLYHLFFASEHADAVRYQTASITHGPLNAIVSATGRLKASLQVKVGSQLSGQIAELFADFNDRVTADQPIAQLDSRSYEARVQEAAAALKLAEARVLLKASAIKEAEANLSRALARHKSVAERITGHAAREDEAQRVMSRTEQLRSRGTSSQAMLDRAMTELQSSTATVRSELSQLAAEQATIQAAEALLTSAQAELDEANATVLLQKARFKLAEIDLSRTTIRSPVDGVIIGRNVDRGQTVATNLEAPTLFEIAQDLEVMEVHLRVDEADIGQVEIGQRVAFSVDSFPGRRYEGWVKQLRKASEVVDNVVAYTVIVGTRNDDGRLLPGMTANAQLFVMERTNAVRLPDAALRFRPAGDTSTQERLAGRPSAVAGPRDARVWVLDEGGAPKAVEIKVGAGDKASSELIAGALTSGDKVIVGMSRAPKRARLLGLRFGF